MPPASDLSPAAAAQAPCLRPARPADIPALLRLEQTFAHDRLSRRSVRRLLAAPSAGWVIAEAEEEILGYALVLFRRGSRIARLYSITVADGRRGHGLGRALLGAAEHLAAAHGADRLRLEVRPDNRNALRLYQAAGYGEIGVRPRFYQDGSPARLLDKALLSL